MTRREVIIAIPGTVLSAVAAGAATAGSMTVALIAVGLLVLWFGYLLLRIAFVELP